MKLLYCLECDDVVRLYWDERSCECGQTGGQYVDNSKAEVFGDGVPFGIHNGSFHQALQERPVEWPGPEFMAFIIPEGSDNIKEMTDG